MRRPIGLRREETSLAIQWSGGGESLYPTFWLRDNCRCPQCRHPGNGQRLYDIADLPGDLSFGEAAIAANGDLRIVWHPDGHATVFSAAWLADHDLAPAARLARKPVYEFWGRAEERSLPRADWPAFLADPAIESGWLEGFARFGCGLLRRSPVAPGTVLTIGNRLGFVRVTNYGALFDVESKPDPNNLAYTALALGVHSDNPYRDPSPGVQLLHCLAAEAPGGDSLLVDGFRAAAILRREAPQDFALLATHRATFRFRDAETDLIARQSLISLDEDGEIVAVHINNRSFDWLDAPAEIAGPWFSAYRRFAAILRRPEGEVVLRLAPGDCLVMQNDRALHGRTAFDPEQGRRHLQGCYIDRDAMESRLRVLRRQRADAKTERVA